MEDLNYHVVEALLSLIIIPSIILLFQFRRFPHLNVSIGSVITSSNSSFKLFVVYRPPSLPIANFFTEFESLLELQIASNIDLFFIGDLNIHIEDLNDYNARHFLKLLNTFDLLQHVSCPTHDSGHTIDLVITNASSKFTICPFTLDTYISDHKTVCIDLDLPKPTVHKTTFSCRQLKKLIFLNLIKILQLIFLMSKISDLTPL